MTSSAKLRWSIWLALRGSSKTNSETESETNADSPAGLKWLAGQVLLSAAAAALLAACLWLPLLEFTRLTSRAVMTPAEAVELSLSPGGLLGLFYPPLSAGSHETTLYVGGVVLLLVVLALAAVPRRPVLFWGLIGGLALLFAMGSSLPGFALLARVPLASLLRVPPRALFLLGLVMAVLAALALDSWEELGREPARRRARLALIGVAASGVTMGVLVLVWLRPERPAPFVWGILGLLAAGLWLMWGLSTRRSIMLFTTGLFVLLLIDPVLAGQAMVAYRPKAEVFAEKASLAEFLQAQPGMFRTYAPDFSLLQFTAYNHGLEQADGVDPLQLEHYVRYMEIATGIPISGYSVTLPPVPDGFAANTRYTPDAQLLGMLNVKYVLAGLSLPATDGLNEITEIEGVHVYENRFARPRAWVTPPGEAVESGEYQPAEILVYTPNRIELSATGPGTLVLAENSYPGWQVQVDGQPQALETAAGTLRAVNLDPGEHEVRFVFRPRTVQFGLIISTAALLGLLGLGLWEAAARRKRLPS
ncbi:MAG: YfhO family protein, partial [Anaerolineales bacterium]